MEAKTVCTLAKPRLFSAPHLINWAKLMKSEMQMLEICGEFQTVPYFMVSSFFGMQDFDRPTPIGGFYKDSFMIRGYLWKSVRWTSTRKSFRPKMTNYIVGTASIAGNKLSTYKKFRTSESVLVGNDYSKLWCELFCVRAVMSFLWKYRFSL